MVYYLYHLDYLLPSQESQAKGPPIGKDGFSWEESDNGKAVGGSVEKTIEEPIEEVVEEVMEEPSTELTTTYRMKDSELVTHAMVYALAEKYYMSGLKDLALCKFKEAVKKQWTSYSFLEAAQETYSSTIESDRGLRDTVVSTFCAHPELLDRKETQTLLRELGALSYDLVMQLHRMKGWNATGTFWGNK